MQMSWILETSASTSGLGAELNSSWITQCYSEIDAAQSRNSNFVGGNGDVIRVMINRGGNKLFGL
jgi:hypothetical protein